MSIFSGDERFLFSLCGEVGIDSLGIDEWARGVLGGGNS